MTLHTETGDSKWDGQPATLAQLEASFAEKTGSGFIYIDGDGDIVGPDSYAISVKVWVA